MGFQNIRKVRTLILCNFAGKKHTAGFPANHACSDHTIAHEEIIHRSEVFSYHRTHLFISRHHDAAHTRTCLRHISAYLVKLLGLVEEAVPEVRILFLPGPLITVHDLIEPAGLNSVEQGLHRSRLPVIEMRQEHRFRVPVPDFFRPHVDCIAERIDVQKKLCCVLYPPDSLQGMLAPYDREKCYRIELEEKRTCHAEKIPHHKIGRPRRLKFGKAVKYVKCVFPLPLDQIVDLHGKILKSVGKLNGHRLNFRPSFGQRFVAGETDIDYVSVIPYRLIQVRI